MNALTKIKLTPGVFTFPQICSLFSEQEYADAMAAYEKEKGHKKKHPSMREDSGQTTPLEAEMVALMRMGRYTSGKAAADKLGITTDKLRAVTKRMNGRFLIERANGKKLPAVYRITPRGKWTLENAEQGKFIGKYHTRNAAIMACPIHSITQTAAKLGIPTSRLSTAIRTARGKGLITGGDNRRPITYTLTPKGKALKLTLQQEG